MPNITTVERFPKATNIPAQLDATAQERIAAGAISSVVTEETDDWVLTTVLPDPNAPPTGETAGPGPTAGANAAPPPPPEFPPTRPVGAPIPAATQQDREDADFEKLMADREGRRNDVYEDTLGKATVGIGHLVTAGDNLKVGDRITDDQVTSLFKKDSARAMSAARSPALEAGISDSAFIPYLASVNFQLGTGWTSTFPHTWRMIVDGKYEDAAKALDETLWAKQTPVRVKDFQAALRRLPAKQ